MGIRNQKVGNVLILVSFRNGLPRRPVGPPYPFCPFGTFPLDKGNRPHNDRLFDRLGSPCGGAGTASAVTERAASLSQGGATRRQGDSTAAIITRPRREEKAAEKQISRETGTLWEE